MTANFHEPNYKGWMQTYIVHNRHPIRFLKDAGTANFLIFQIYVGGLIFSAPLHLAFVCTFTIKALTNPQVTFDLTNTASSGLLFALVGGYLGPIALSVVGALRRRDRKRIHYQITLPLYWALVGFAAMRAMFELVFRPFFWAKTAHGLTMFNRRTERRSPARTTWELDLRRPDLSQPRPDAASKYQLATRSRP